MIELLVVIAIAGIIMAVGAPTLWSYWRTATLNAAAEELTVVLNRGRQLAINQNSTVCVTSNAGTVSFFVGCGAVAWTRQLDTDAAGAIRLRSGVTITNAVTVTFNYLGAATTPGTFIVRNPVDARTLSVCVATTGRVRIGTLANPCP
jgi:Tfp pilus assembly protein FimT